jgi:hypothetical protein
MRNNLRPQLLDITENAPNELVALISISEFGIPIASITSLMRVSYFKAGCQNDDLKLNDEVL